MQWLDVCAKRARGVGQPTSFCPDRRRLDVRRGAVLASFARATPHARRQTMASSRITAALATALLFVSVSTAAWAAPKSPVVATDDGPVRGTTIGRMQAFLGIPYAAPPVGA